MAERDKKTARVSVAVAGKLKGRLETCATKTRLGQHLLIEAAMNAAAEAIEKAGYRVVFPIEFAVKYVPAPADSLTLEDDRPRSRMSRQQGAGAIR